MPTKPMRAVFLVLLTPGLAVAQHQADLFVDPNGSDTSGADWAHAFKKIQTAVDNAFTDDHIAVAQGTYTKGSSSSGDRAVVEMVSDVHIHGGFKGNAGGSTASMNWDEPDGIYNATVIDGEDDETHVIFADAFGGTARTYIDGFKVKRGLADGTSFAADWRGGGIYVAGSATFIRLENVNVKNNKADNGTNGEGGGIYHSGAGGLECIKSVIEDNIAPTGAGFYTDLADANTFGNTVFKDNGFGLMVPLGESATTGGAIYMKDSVVSAMNCTFFDNESVSQGAAIFWDPTGANNKRLSLRHCTLAFNPTDSTLGVGLGSGIHILSGNSNNSLDIANCILWAEDPGYDIFWGTGAAGQVTLNVSYSDIGDSWDQGAVPPGAIAFPGNVISSDPFFVDTAARDLRLGKSGTTPSPCIDSGLTSLIPQDMVDVDEDGDTSETLPIDLLGNKRLVNFLGGAVTNPDMGAYESHN